MKHAWIVVLTGKYGIPYYYGPFYDKDKAELFCNKECVPWPAKVVELIVVER